MLRAQAPATGITARAAGFAVAGDLRFPAEALAIATLSIYDCLAVTVAGLHEPVSRAVRELVRGEGGEPQAGLVGLGARVPARAAALANGAAAHALDYDDTHFDFVGHPSVAVLPAALASAEHRQADGQALLEAFLVGVETACRIGAWLGRDHYNAGFHQTATSGAFGATAAASRLLGLDARQAAHALGLAATRAAGLKCQFGTMAKPLHAGMAASTGVEAALLASLGLASRADALECDGGFAATHAGAPGGQADPFAGLPDAYRFVDVQHKFHACCHGMHPALEALSALRREHAPAPATIGRVSLRIAPQWLPVCCIERPATGLQAKFSLALTAAMVLAGRDTASLATFSDACCEDAELLALAGRVEIQADPGIADTACRAEIAAAGGATYARYTDLSDRQDYGVRAGKLRSKAEALLGAASARALWDIVQALPTLRTPALYRDLHGIMAAAAAAQR